VESENYIGKTCTITKAKNKAYEGLNGTIINETKNTIVLLVNGTEKKILKNAATFTINKKKVEGKNIIKHIEDRIKSRGKKQ